MGISVCSQKREGIHPPVVANWNDHNLGLGMDILFQLINREYTTAGRPHDELRTLDNTKLKNLAELVALNS